MCIQTERDSESYLCRRSMRCGELEQRWVMPCRIHHHTGLQRATALEFQDSVVPRKRCPEGSFTKKCDIGASLQQSRLERPVVYLSVGTLDTMAPIFIKLDLGEGPPMTQASLQSSLLNFIYPDTVVVGPQSLGRGVDKPYPKVLFAERRSGGQSGGTATADQNIKERRGHGEPRAFIWR